MPLDSMTAFNQWVGGGVRGGGGGGLTICLWLELPWFNYGFHLFWHTVELAMSTCLCLS